MIRQPDKDYTYKGYTIKRICNSYFVQGPMKLELFKSLKKAKEFITNLIVGPAFGINKTGEASVKVMDVEVEDSTKKALLSDTGLSSYGTSKAISRKMQKFKGKTEE